MASTSNVTNRFLEVLNGFSERKTQCHKRSRAEAVDHFAATASTVLYTSSTPRPPLGKRPKVVRHTDTNQVLVIVKKDETTGAAASSASEELWKADMDYYQNCLEKEKQDLKQIEDTRNEVLQEIVDVWGVYKYGLMQIGALADLSEAPDAIMPGNF